MRRLSRCPFCGYPCEVVLYWDGLTCECKSGKWWHRRKVYSANEQFPLREVNVYGILRD